MKNQNLAIIFVLGFLAMVINGCNEKNLNPECPKIGYYFMGDVAGKQVCMGDGRNGFYFTDGGYAQDNNFYVPGFDLGAYVFGNRPYAGSCYITCGLLTQSQCNMKYFKDSLFSIGPKKIRGATNKMEGFGGFNINIIPPSVSDTLAEHHYDAFYNDQTGSEFRVTELKQMNDSLLVVNFLINCKLYDENNVYVGKLKNGEFKCGIIVYTPQ